jgi:hypothetical protein
VLKINVTETQTESRWILQGQLVGPWVNELRRYWKAKHRESRKRCVVDLNDVMFIDKTGERLLRAMSKKGAEFVASGIYTRHVLERLKTRRKGALSRFLACLFAGLVATGISFSPSMRAIESVGHLSAREDAGTRRKPHLLVAGQTQRVSPFERD